MATTQMHPVDPGAKSGRLVWLPRISTKSPDTSPDDHRRPASRSAPRLVITSVLLCVAAVARAQVGTPPPVTASFESDTLQLEFAQPMQVWDNTSRTDVVRLAPTLALQCTWSSDTMLSCIGGHPARATRYRISVAGGLMTQAGAALPAQTLHAETTRPQLSASIRRWRDGIPEIVVNPQDSASARAIASVLRLRIDGKPAPLPTLRRDPAQGSWDDERRYVVMLPHPVGEHRVELAIVPGLAVAAGPLRGEQHETLVRAQVNEPFNLRSVKCTSREGSATVKPTHNTIQIGCLPGESVQLAFSHAPAATSDTALAAELPPGIKLERQYQGNEWEWRDAGEVARSPPYLVELSVDRAQANVALPLDAWRDQQGVRLRPVTVHIHTGDFRPMLHAAHDKVLIADPSHANGMISAINPTAARIAVESVGASARNELLSLPMAAQRNEAVVVASDSATRSLAEGGWAQWTPQVDEQADKRYGNRSYPVQFAAPQLDLLALASRREVLAWVNDWAGRSAVGSHVQLLWLDAPGGQPRVIAETRADGAGLAHLSLPEGLVLPDEAPNAGYPLWLVRVTDQASAQRAVLPFLQQYGMDLGKAAPTKLWGVSDRPLYHAGDTVKYHLWLRERRGGRLMATTQVKPVTLRLTNTFERTTIQQWTAVPKDGVINGELVLPIHLPDETYCIGIDDDRYEEGDCFFVGTYRAQDLWAQATAVDRVLRDGDVFSVDLAAGYYSGGPAAGVRLTEFSTMLTGLPLSAAYPQFADYSFIDVNSDDAREGIALAGARALQLVADGQGRAHVTLPVQFAPVGDHKPDLPAFGRLQLVATAKLSDREGTASNAAQVRYTRYDRFVGVRLQPGWLDATTPVQVTGIVIDADGRPVADADVDIDVDYLAGYGGTTPEPAAQRLTHCHVASGILTPCNFPRLHSGRYRLVARSGAAAVATLTQYVWVDDVDVRDARQSTELTLEQAPTRPGDPLRVMLKQGSVNARVLFVIGSGDTILATRVETMIGSAKDFVFAVDPAWRKQVTVTAYVRDGDPSTSTEDGLRRPAQVTSDSVTVPLPDPPPTPASLVVSFDPMAAKPGDVVHVTVRNTTANPRGVVLAVMDDALRALAGEELAYSDPNGPSWLGERSYWRGTQFALASFSDWNRNDWQLALPWPRAVRKPSADPRMRHVDAEIASPMSTPSPMAGASANLDRIEVTGSRISIVDVFTPGATPMHGLRLNPRGEGGFDATSRLATLARVRRQFADTALWAPDIQLAPGASRTLELTLPDNLTRWRAVAWSSNADDDFDMAQATLEVGLPLEVRLQAPVRMYPGDRARLAANVHQAGTDAVQAQAQLLVQSTDGDSRSAQSVALSGAGQGSFALDVAPRSVGSLLATASAQTHAGRDAVAATVEVASPLIAAHNVQAGWLDGRALDLAIPALPAGATDPVMHVSLLRGNAGLVTRWTQDLRDYPHRCWEQILSRAVAAAIALERGDTQWPDAKAVVQEAVDNAAVFQSDEGDFRYFAGRLVYDDSRPEPKPEVALTAYTVRALALLRTLGHPVAPEVEEHARTFLKTQRIDTFGVDLADSVFAAAADEPLTEIEADRLLTQWHTLPMASQVAATTALAQSGHAQARVAMARVLAAAPLHGSVRVLGGSHQSDRWMGSPLQEQCALIELLGRYPDIAPAGARRELLAGLGDLYSGGIAAVDTQTGATCLMALRHPPADDASSPAATVDMGSSSAQLQLAPGVLQADWQAPLAGQTHLQIVPKDTTAPFSYVAQLDYQEDARQARASAVGFSVQRHYDVLRAGQWVPVDNGVVHEGQWVRIRLEVDSAATRYFVALTDAVPGGLRPTDLSLSGIAGLDLKQVSGTGSWWFQTRQLDARQPKFYAQTLPAGHHEVDYFAVASNDGDYLAAPAQLELMYGDASRARTAATRVQIIPAPNQASPPH